jgi:hypothetical protein
MQTITDNEVAQPNGAAEYRVTHLDAGVQTPTAEAPVPVEDIENLVVRIAGSEDGESIDELAERAGGGRRPTGALMLAAIDGKVLAAASMARREALSEPTPSGLAARAVVEYTLAGLERRGSMPRRAA